VGVYGGPDVSESGLVLALDGANYKSFKGEATTNLIPSPTTNAYPTTGNGWGTYNTNQYGSGTYFSIGSVASVSSNIVTMTSSHSLRTYDVMQPQTTGGGVSAGVNYFIKKVSDTSFTLHEYNGSQDGSQGYISSSTGTHKVYDSIANDTRISVNSTSFPTMWWGAPHLPNSGLVKELRYGEFNAIPNLPANDCIRLHYIRTDDVKDGMSYGVDCTVTPSSPVTVSFYTRAANANAVGKVIQYYTYNYSGGSATSYAMNFTLGQVGVWERQTFTFTPAYGTMISYWFPQSGGVYSWDWSCMQVEQKSYVTSFIAGTRGTTVATGGGWADLIGNGNNGELVNGVKENSANGGSLSFDGADDYVTVSNNISPGTGDFAVSVWVYKTETSANRYVWDFGVNGGTLASGTSVSQGFRYYNPSIGGGGSLYTAGPIHNINTWYNIVISRISGTTYFYSNGSLITSGADAGDIGSWGTSLTIGGYGGGAGYYHQGNISNFLVYKGKGLSATEIQQNFNATRSRYGI
jgi:hypothetical protein